MALGPDALEHPFYPIYADILGAWFPPEEYQIRAHFPIRGNGRPDYAVSHLQNPFDPFLIIEIKRPNKCTPSGKEEVQEKLEKYIEKLFEVTERETVLGLAGIGLNWALFRMRMTGPPESEVVLEWNDNVSSDESFDIFQNTIMPLVNPIPIVD